jgi:hypothetical protein
MPASESAMNHPVQGGASVGIDWLLMLPKPGTDRNDSPAGRPEEAEISERKDGRNPTLGTGPARPIC